MMDFLDPKKSRAHNIRLIIGYMLVAIAVGLATMVLFYISSGFAVKSGKVVQNGRVFISTNPGGADIYLNGQKQNDTSNASLVLPSGTYTMRLVREGYREWQRALTVEGGSVDHFDYPLLIPNTLSPGITAEYAAEPPLTTQSPDRRWILVQRPGAALEFDVFDTKDPKKVRTERKAISLPAAVPELPLTGDSSFKLVEWSNDNSHALLQHTAGGKLEYLMLSRDKPAESVNLTRQLELPVGATISLQDKKFDRYFIHDPATQKLVTAALGSPATTPMLSGVLDFKTYGDNVVLYATADGATEGKVVVKLYQNDKSYPIRQVAQSTDYLLDISWYGAWYTVVGSPAEAHVYVYKDPAKRLQQDVTLALAPVEVLKLNNPNYVEFSANSQFVMAENGQDIAVFDAENERSYTYRLDRPLDAPQTHVSWLDGFHLRYVSRNLAVIFDYDGTNVQNLSAASPGHVPMYDTGYQTLYNITPLPAAGNGSTGGHLLTSTPLRTDRDR